MSKHLRDTSNLNFGIFNSNESFERFLANSIIQYAKLKFGSKRDLLKSVEAISREKISGGSSYSNIALFLYQKSPEDFRKIFGVSHPIEICHLYSFYKVIMDIFYETSWMKNFTPFYKFLFGREVRISTKKEKRVYAAQIITSFNQSSLQRKYLEFSSSYGSPPVIHYGHLTIGPLGFIFTPYYKEKEILEISQPTLNVLTEWSPEGKYIINWERTNLTKFFPAVMNDMKSKMISLLSKCPVYKQYLSLIGFDEAIFEEKKDALSLSKDFKEKISQNLIPVWFYEIVQLSSMFLTDEEVIKLLNKLIAEDILVIKVSEIDLHNVKVTKDCFLLKPKSWLVKPSIDLARDLSESKEEFPSVLTEILKVGAINFLNSLYETHPEEFSKLLNKRGLYKFSKLEPTSIPRETAIRRLLESYGFQAPSQWGFEIRSIIKDYIYELREFKKKRHQLKERDLVNNIISLLKDGRDYLERIIKEFAYILIILILNLKYVAEHKIEISFLFERPLAMPSSYSRDRDLYNLKRGVFNLLKTLLDPFVFSKINQRRLTLGDWLSLIRCLLNYLERNQLYKELMMDMNMRLERFKYLISQVEKEGISTQLNIASHEAGRREIMTDSDSRKNAINVLLEFDVILENLYSCLPPLAKITREVREIETGLQYYEARIFDENFKEKTLKIYGTRLIEPSETYYVFMRKKEDRVTIYPLLIANLVDTIL